MKRVQVTAAALRYPAEDRLAAGAVLSGNEPKPRTEVSSSRENFTCDDGSDRRGRDQWTEAGGRHKPPAISLLLADLFDLLSNFLDPPIEPQPIFVQPTINWRMRGEISSSRFFKIWNKELRRALAPDPTTMPCSIKNARI